MNNSLVFDSAKISLGESLLYQGDILSHALPINSLTNGNQYFSVFTVWQGTLSANSRQIPFFCYTTPTLTISVPSTITSKKYSFVVTYFQEEYISTNYWYMVFLNSNDEIILTTPNSNSGLISYEFDGFINNLSYKMYTVVTNQQNVVIQSSIYTFTVSYASPSLVVKPTATLFPELSATKIQWSNPVQSTGLISGTSAYVSGLFTTLNTGLNLDITWNESDTVDDTITFDETSTYDEFYGASLFLNDLFGKASVPNYVEFEVDIPEIFTLTIDYIPSVSFAGGKMIRLENIDLTFFEIGYNPEIGCFYYNNNNFILNGTPKELPLQPFLIAIKGVQVLIILNNVIYEYIFPQ